MSQKDHVRKTICVGSKVLATIDGSEHFKFLPILTELIVWGATDEKVDDLVEKIIKSADWKFCKKYVK